ncbi:DNA topoisomerase 3 [Colletotrichum sp. SAR 10_70]|nr:DNA topoisomerase 3 [Colletotrichum sp. SAR 10_71]KAI8184410.1 DNA topoisomerase 3 [Colletotrichum sp. SAR 10_70]KAI8187777.1 DNA topoisomerase 3 [Colletotrichum sp. SAR 10_75]KAI8190924.1 DNA topoisomerase 3 [Colletotrichum sp. SAR 10_65]KAI8208471.1 DNA topoisomerase 3 [Colletotrichum sp. SAR 10_76]KAI8248119.1 DNA topoisomerase 3 [Colletotrichum sp. SAR 10_77]KAJ4999614.1 DNA topoisomerase 3 [Colletotrichum sp. SAR 10_66]
MKVLCVAEKPSISKAVAGHLAGQNPTVHNTRSTYIKNYGFNFNFGPPWNACDVTMTAVLGHLTALDFTPANKSWQHPPPESLFTAPVVTLVPDDKKTVAENIERQARYCQLLVIWTDCDREGEHIGKEIVHAARKGKPDIQVKRATFSNIERAHILSAARRLTDLDQKQVDAVDTRIELDLRIGYAFTRFLTLSLRPLGGALQEKTISYGSCQFPTLGFVVDRYFRVQNFVPEQFWSIKVMHNREGKKANFSWSRNRLFDRMSVVILYERCIRAKKAKVTKVQEKATRKWKPLPLTTVELQKAATRLLRMSGQQAMTIAENLYNRGFISYPRTETDRFDKGMDLKALVRKQTPHQRWGEYAEGLLNGNFSQPREGRHDDKAHPPIHPVTYAAPSVLKPEEAQLYEYVVRRFLACCSEDAKGMATDIEILYGEETFHARGLRVLERNYLDVFIYEKWNDSAELPHYTQGETFVPTEAMMTDGKTSPPGYLTEADLIALMDANGIGTDATMAEHIQKIQDREYVQLADGGRRSQDDDDGDDQDRPPSPPARGRGRGNRGRGGRGGRAASGGRTGLKVFIPTQLGVALIMGFDRMEFETSLGKPFLRKEMENKMKAICDGRMSKEAVLRESLGQYRQVFRDSQERLNVLKAACREYMAL